MAKYPSKAVANWLIDRYAADGGAMTQLQLYKMVFIAHGWHLAIRDKEEGLIAETVHAWKYGPVIPVLREEFRGFGSEPISQKATDWLSFDEFVTPELMEYCPDEEECEILEWVYAQYGALEGPELIRITHMQGTPWHTVTKGGNHIPFNLKIPNTLIRSYYSEQLGRMAIANG